MFKDNSRYKGDLFVSVNGVSYKIRRGVEVEVPPEVAEVLEHSQVQDEMCIRDRRKTYPQLSDLVDKSMAYYKRAFPTAQYNATSHVWVFPSGAKIYFGSMQYTKDRTNYQGKAFDFIGFDELTPVSYTHLARAGGEPPAQSPVRGQRQRAGSAVSAGSPVGGAAHHGICGRALQRRTAGQGL